jgi:dienelactone hydrolase
MRTVILRPPGPGPFPLMVMNHGSTQSAERRMAMALPDYGALARWFVRRGYAVALPQRPGHGATAGPYLEDQNGCDDADFLTAGYGAADSIAAAIAYLTTQPFVRRGGVIVVGQSAGAWGALALASRNPGGVTAVIAFAPGRGGRSYDRAGVNCVPERLVDAARRYGTTARLPTLWLYTENDSYFPPRLSRRLFEAFRTGSASRADYHLLPAFGADGHFLAEQDAAEPLWAPVLDEFLRRLR